MVTALFCLEDSRRIHPRSVRACQPKDLKRREWRSVCGRGRERERKSTCMRERKRERKCFGSSFYTFFPPPGPALCKLGLARSAACSTWSLHSGPRTFLWPYLFFSHHHFGLLFPILPTYTQKNNINVISTSSHDGITEIYFTPHHKE